MTSKDIAVLGIICFLGVAYSGCKKDKPNPSEGPIPVIQHITPSSGTKGTVVTIVGSGFSTDISEISVFINGSACAILEAGTTEVIFVVSPGVGTGLVTIDINGKAATGPVFNFIYTVTVSNYSGTPGVAGFADGGPFAARYHSPRGITIDEIGNLYIADELNHRIRRISPGGDVTTFAGNGTAGHLDGPSNSARFNRPHDVEVDEINGFFYVADKLNHCIRRISLSGDVTTAAGIPGSPGYVDAPGLSARLNGPTGVAIEGELLNLYIADAGNHCIRKLDHLEVLSTFAGSGVDGLQDGFGSGAKFSLPYDIAWDSLGYLFVSDAGNHNIRKIKKSSVEVTTVAGNGIAGYQDGPANLSLFNSPGGLSAWKGEIVICDKDNHRIRAVSLSKNVTSLAGDGTAAFLDGPGAQARFNQPGGIVRNKEGEYFICDTENHCIRKMIVD